MIRLSVPGSLLYRDLVLRVVESSCKLVQPAATGLQDAGQTSTDDAFERELVSAFGEAFNNVAIHGYGAREVGKICIEIALEPGKLTVKMLDWGRSFDAVRHAPQAPPALPESGMGLFIMHSFTDELRYHSGSPPDEPNVLELVKLKPGRAAVANRNVAGVSGSGRHDSGAGNLPGKT